jgi:hypothetical protein
MAAGTHKLMVLLELVKPSLEFLCTLAKEIYWIETGHKDWQIQHPDHTAER